MWFQIAASIIDDAARANAGANNQGHWKDLELWDHRISRSILEKRYILLLVERRHHNCMEAFVFEWRYHYFQSHVVLVDRVIVEKRVKFDEMHCLGPNEQPTLESLFGIRSDISTNLGAVFFGNSLPSLSTTTEDMMVVLTDGLVDNFHRFKVDGQDSLGSSEFSVKFFVQKLQELLSLKEGDSKGREVQKKGKGGVAPRLQILKKAMDRERKRLEVEMAQERKRKREEE